jgi:ribosome-binding protein aMBF1 (putative translation factor)
MNEYLQGEKAMKKKNGNIKTWSQIKDEQFGKKGTALRDELDREFDAFKIGILLRKARQKKNLTQEDLAEIISKKRSYISRVENDGSNITLKTLFDIVEKGLGGKVNISIQV